MVTGELIHKLLSISILKRQNWLGAGLETAKALPVKSWSWYCSWLNFALL